MGFGASKSSCGSGRPILKFSTNFLWDNCPHMSEDHVFKFQQVPEGSGMFADSLLKTSFSALVTHDDQCHLHKYKNHKKSFQAPKLAPKC
jgi:hypothetical protein